MNNDLNMPSNKKSGGKCRQLDPPLKKMHGRPKTAARKTSKFRAIQTDPRNGAAIAGGVQRRVTPVADKDDEHVSTSVLKSIQQHLVTMADCFNVSFE